MLNRTERRSEKYEFEKANNFQARLVIDVDSSYNTQMEWNGNNHDDLFKSNCRKVLFRHAIQGKSRDFTCQNSVHE